MADDSKIVITAGLQIPETVQTITKDLKQVANQLNSNHALKIVANIDLGKSTQRIQSQLATIGKDLKINVASINAQSIQQNLTEATKNQKVEVDITPKFSKNELQKQAKEMEEILGLFDRGGKQSGRNELAVLLEEYQKAFKTQNYEGTVDALNKIIDFTQNHKKNVEITNEELKAQQERVRGVLTEMKKLYITTEQLEAIQRELTGSKRNINGQTTEAENFLNSYLGKRKWDSDPTKFINVATQYWSNFVDNVNNIIHGSGNKYMELLNEGDIVEGLRNYVDFMGKSTDQTNEYMRSNALSAEQWADEVANAITKVTGTSLGEIANWGFVDIITDQETEHIEQNAQTIQNSVNGVTQSIQNLSSNTGVNMNLSINREAINQFTSQLQNLGVQGVNIDEIRNRFQNLGITINQITPTFKTLQDGTEALSTISIKGRDATNQLIEYTEKWKTTVDKDTNEVRTSFDSATTKIVQNFEKIRAAEEKTRQETDTKQKAYNKYLELLGKANVYMKQFSGEERLKESFQELIELLANFRQSDPIEKQQEAIIKLDNALKLIKVDIDEISEARGQSVAKTQEQLDAMAAKQLHLLQQYQELEAKISKSGTTMSAVAIREDNGVKTDYSAIFNTIINGTIKGNAELKKAQNALTTIRNEFKLLNAQTGSTLPQNAIENFATNASKLHNRFETLKIDYDEIKNKSSELSEKFEKLSTDIKQFQNFDKASISTKEELREQVLAYTEVKRLLDEVKTATTSALNVQSKQESEYKKLTNSLNGYIKALQAFNNSSIVKKNSGNSDVVAQMETNENLIAHLQAFSQSLKDDSSAENLKWVQQFLSTLIPTIEKATQDSEALNQQLKNTGADQNLANQIRNLTNQMDVFASTNRKATESLKQMRNGVTFADEWKRITEALKSGKLDENAIKQLTQDFKNFKAQAQSAGITVSQFFTSMQSQIRMVLQRWISLYAIIGRVTSAFNELKEVDKILTEIAKSSDVTRESLESLGNAAFDMANKYGRSVTDYLYGVQEFSRAGFRGEQLTGLTEVSLLAQSAGDIETDLANSYVIATNAAYGFAGSQEKLGEVLDRQNYVTNNYALNMTDLANATKIAASQAAQSGVEIDQMTAALATMISTTQQGGEIAARSLRGILMNIQQVKGEVGDGEEDITEESLTKYEKAAKDLGVALKEVKDGATVLRDPMAVLNDLAEAFNKEADDSIKKANLINAIGGKFYLVA